MHSIEQGREHRRAAENVEYIGCLGSCFNHDIVERHSCERFPVFVIGTRC